MHIRDFLRVDEYMKQSKMQVLRISTILCLSLTAGDTVPAGDACVGTMISVLTKIP